MAPSAKIPAATDISPAHFRCLLELYPTVLELLYKSKIKDPKKLSAALEDDTWRYETLPKELKMRVAKAPSNAKRQAYLSKDELARLVQWKITHGKYRPFLPALIRKNDPKTVEDVTKDAFKIQASESYDTKKGDSLPAKLADALKRVSTLQGVGPATAPLICSVLDPENVPFFEDELYEWLFPDSAKLKYNLKEYQSLFHAARELRKKIPLATAAEVEKVGLVFGHIDLLNDNQKEAYSATVVHLDKEAHGVADEPPLPSKNLEDVQPTTKAHEKPQRNSKAKTKEPSKAAGRKRSIPQADEITPKEMDNRPKRKKVR